MTTKGSGAAADGGEITPARSGKPEEAVEWEGAEEMRASLADVKAMVSDLAAKSPGPVQLENEIASLNKKEAALILSSFYVANDTTLFTLAPSFQDTSTSRSFPPGPWARFTATSGDMWPPPAMEQVN